MCYTGKLAFGSNVDITYCGYNSINYKIKELIESKEYLEYEHIIITDISVNEEVAELINSTLPKNSGNTIDVGDTPFTLFDHHQTALSLNKYWWSNVCVDDENGKCSGTSLFYELMIRDYITDYCNDYTALDKFVETVRRYDTWEWHTRYNDDVPR